MVAGVPKTTWPEHYRLRFEGFFDSGSNTQALERWSFGVNIARIDGLNLPPVREIPSENDYILNQALPCIRYLFTDVASNVVCDSIKFNRINNLGHYFDPSITHESHPNYSNWGSEIRGTAGPVKYPTEVSLVVSLRTDANRGPAHHGRFYLPSPGAAIAADTRISVAGAQAIASTMRDGLALLVISENGGLDEYGPVVVSPMASAAGGSLDPGPGTVRRVSTVSVGRVLDVMRSRRRSLDEDYQSIAMP